MKNSFSNSTRSERNNNGTIDRCVYGYVGSFNDAIKPLLLVYLIGSAVGTGLFAVLSEDASREFVISTLLHLIPEMLVWTHLLFPPHPPKKELTRYNFCGRWGIRTFFGLGTLMLFFGPLHMNENGTHMVIGPAVTKVYFILAGISDFLGLWLGLLMMTRRTHVGARRIGVTFFIHSASFHVHAFELFCQGDGFGIPVLRGFSWFILLFATLFAFLGMVPLLRTPLDLRDQQPTTGEQLFLVGGVVTSFLVIPLLASKSINYRLLPEEIFELVMQNPSFLPRDIRVLTAYKIIVPLLSFVFMTYVLQSYVDTRVPILPITTTTSHNKDFGSSVRSSGGCPASSSTRSMTADTNISNFGQSTGSVPSMYTNGKPTPCPMQRNKFSNSVR